MNLNPEWSHTFLFSLGYVAYLPTKHFTFITKALKNISPPRETLEVVKNIPSIANSNSRAPSSREVFEMAQFYCYLKNFLMEKKINLIVCHNDLRWQHAIAKKICLELNIKILFFEEGYFRPNTITVDQKGVNAFSSLPLSPDFYQAYEPIKKPFKTFSNASSFSRIMRLVHFNIFMILDAVGSTLNLNTTTRNKEYSFAKYLKLFINKLRTQLRNTKGPESVLPKKYIFVALQVAEDTQTVIHSPYSGTQEFIDDVEKSFYSIPETQRAGVSLVFKKHPMEGSKTYRFNSKSIVSAGDTNTLIKSSIGIILINSSTIAQCLQLNKSVITLGSSFFDIEGMTYKSNKIELSNAILKLIRGEIKSDETLYQKFLEYLKNEYQYNMNLYYYNKDDIHNFVNELKNRELR